MTAHAESHHHISDLRDLDRATVCAECGHYLDSCIQGRIHDEETRRETIGEHYPDCPYIARVIAGCDDPPREERVNAEEWRDCAPCAIEWVREERERSLRAAVQR